MAAKASTPAEHRALEEYFLTLAKRYTADATEHATTANTYRGTRTAQAAVHCDPSSDCRRTRPRKQLRRRRCTSSLRVLPGSGLAFVRVGVRCRPGGNRLKQAVMP